MANGLADFLAVAHQFQLGSLDTEMPHPLTSNLSHQAKMDLPSGIAALKAVDLLALEKLAATASDLIPLATAVNATLAAGKYVFLAGCGATGRLAMNLETLCRQGLLEQQYRERVIGFTAGGDVALIRAVPGFEDNPEFGARQLAELGFADGDLCVAATEGGETPFVIGVVEYAAEHSRTAPWFLYCNPEKELAAKVERSRRVLGNPRISKLNLAVGPMAICGSTRMQASTVLTAAIGFALANHANPPQAAAEAEGVLDLARDIDWSFLADFILREEEIYREGGRMLYEPGPFGLTVLTDAVERCPTFTIPPFENQRDTAAQASWCHLHIPGQSDAMAAWRWLLAREPRALEWDGLAALAGKAMLPAFDFSDGLLRSRRQRLGDVWHGVMAISEDATGIRWQMRGGTDQRETVAHVPLASAGVLQRHLILKLLLNTHSTLLMGRMGRYEDNLMTFVNPTNHKLVDRAIRYVRILQERQTGRADAYETVAAGLFRCLNGLQADESVVLKTLEALKK